MLIARTPAEESGSAIAAGVFANRRALARGDLGVETDLAEIPTVQKRITALAKARARPVITATQMLESMVKEERPTQVEVTDVANASLDGTDAVMIPAETAIGQFPLAAAGCCNGCSQLSSSNSHVDCA